jgi:hypothetical protein
MFLSTWKCQLKHFIVWNQQEQIIHNCSIIDLFSRKPTTLYTWLYNYWY